MNVSRRTALYSLCGCIALAGCSFYRERPPVVIGGSPVAKDQSIMVGLRASSEHRRLVAALEATGLDAELDGIGPLTVFAPTDAAFDALMPESAKTQIEQDQDYLKEVLSGQIVRARLTTRDLRNVFPQLNGKTKVFALNKQVIQAEGVPKSPRLVDLRGRTVSVVQRDAIAKNGIIHVTDGLLLPQEKRTDGG